MLDMDEQSAPLKNRLICSQSLNRLIVYKMFVWCDFDFRPIVGGIRSIRFPRPGIGDGLQDQIAPASAAQDVAHIVAAALLELGWQHGDPHGSCYTAEHLG
jgi:hypothetical protein